MVDYDLSVLGQLQVELHAEAAPHRQVKGFQGVFRHAFVLVVETSVGIVKFVEGGEIRPGQLGSNGPQPQHQDHYHNRQQY